MKTLPATAFAAIFTLALLAASPASATATYSVTPLGTLPGGDVSIATAINASGQIVGNSENMAVLALQRMMKT